MLGVALAGSFAVGGGWRSAAHPSAEPIGMVQDSDMPQDPRPPVAWLQGDPADSLYRAAREALDRRDFRAAADLFAQVPSRFPKSGYAADAYYWRAFALYRLGGTAQLKAALQALDTQRTRYPKAATKGDANALESRIQGELARQGDPDAMAIVVKDADDAATPPVPPVPPSSRTPILPPPPPVQPMPPMPPMMPGSDTGCADDADDT